MVPPKVSKCFRLLLLSIILIYLVVPIIFRHSPRIQRFLLFMNNVNTQSPVDLEHPERLGIKCARTLRLAGQELATGGTRVELGVWQILPQSSLKACVTKQDINRTLIEDALAFADSRPIIFYVHGNGGNRAGRHRGNLYRRLAYKNDFHVITFDYRGYGDSTYLEPTSEGLHVDATFVYKWLLDQPNVTPARVTVWGHSLGTAIATRMVAELPAQLAPSRLVLEAPFDTISNAVANHPFSKPFSVMPYFNYFFVEPIQQAADLDFNSLNRIGAIKKTPILIVHAEDDAILPFELGHNLYKHAVQTLGASAVKLIRIDASQGLGHNRISRHEDTMRKVRQFICDECDDN